jgi:uncharacterized membrane protein YuzA (DUF378 family)
MPSRNLMPASLWSVLGGIVVGLMGIFSFRTRGTVAAAQEERDERRRVA